MPETNGNGGINFSLGSLIKAEHLPKQCGYVLMLVVLIVSVLYSWHEWGESFYQPEVSRLEVAQTTEGNLHIFETPTEKYTMANGDDEILVFGGSDECLAAKRKLDDGFFDITWSFHPDRKAAILEAPLTSGGLKTAGMGGCYGPGPGCCYDPHPEPMELRVDRDSYCLDIVWHRFPHRDGDACLGYRVADPCEGVFLTPLIWERCIH